MVILLLLHYGFKGLDPRNRLKFHPKRSFQVKYKKKAAAAASQSAFLRYETSPSPRSGLLW